MEPITVPYQVISSDFTRWDKFKRKRRSFWKKATDVFRTAGEKIRTATKAIALFLHNLVERCNSRVTETWDEIKQDWELDMDNPIKRIANFLLGPPVPQTEQGAENYTEFSTGNVAGSMMGAVRSQNGYICEEQVEQFGVIAQNSTENLNRLKTALKHIKTVDGNETETTKEVFKVMDALERNAHKRSQYEYNRRREHQLLEEKNKGLRKGL